MYRVLAVSILSLFTLVFALGLFAQPGQDYKPPLTRILFVFDASKSMTGQWEKGAKMDVAQRLLSELLDSLKQVDNNIELALRVYGHQKNFPPQDCDDSRLEVPFANDNYSQLQSTLRSITPRGTTPIALSLERSANDFPDCRDCRNIIILITDGIEECGGDPCAMSMALRRKNVVLKPFVIGMGLTPEIKETFKCVGTYFDATNERTFKTVLNIVISQALNNTSAQVNLLDKSYRPTETNVPFTLYDHFSGRILHNYIHTMNHRGNPDTLYLDPLLTYDMVVHTIPPVRKDSITLVPGKHNVIAADAPQGTLHLKASGAGNYKELTCIVRKQDDMNTLHVQNFNEQEKYIVGKYDLEILSIPRIHLNDVEILQSHTNTVEIPKPGILKVNMPESGYGSIFLEDQGKLKWVYNLVQNQKSETVILQPGRYRVIYRKKTVGTTLMTVEEKVTIESGGSSLVKMY